jgi:hypothetical protein
MGADLERASGRPAGVWTPLTSFVGRAAEVAALGYFENNAPRMRYHWFRQCGLFVGSGVVESSCKTVISSRLKQSGMHWTLPGADAIIALRCQEASSHWEAVCNTPDSQTRTA